MLIEKQFVNEILLLARLDDLIDRYFRKYKDSGFYSAKLNLTTRVLNASTRLYRNKTIFELIQDRVVTEARQLLSNSRMSVKLIAYDLGFEDPAYFCRFFKKMRGMTPQQYRKQCLLQQAEKNIVYFIICMDMHTPFLIINYSFTN